MEITGSSTDTQGMFMSRQRSLIICDKFGVDDRVEDDARRAVDRVEDRLQLL